MDEPAPFTGVLGPEAYSKLYSYRFSADELAVREAVWRVVVPRIFQPFISSGSDTVVDLGAGDGCFIRNVAARRRVAVDVDTNVLRLKSQEIETYVARASELTNVLQEPANVIFMSNFLEHMPTKAVVLETLEECARATAPGGLLMILQPNIRYAGAAYWDYLDHHIALTEQSLCEAVIVSGFEVVKVIPRFLPYTAKSTTGHIASWIGAETLTRIYVRFPFLWRIFGQQTFVVARRRRRS